MMRKYFFPILLLSFLAHVTVAGTLIYMPYQLSNDNHLQNPDRIIWGIMQNQDSGSSGGRSTGLSIKEVAVSATRPMLHMGGPSIRKKSRVKDISADSDTVIARTPEATDAIPDTEDSEQVIYSSSIQEVNSNIHTPIGLSFQNENQNQDIIQSGVSGDCSEPTRCIDGVASGDYAGINGTGSGGGNGSGGIERVGGVHHDSGLKGFLNYISREIERHKYYPASARENDIEGTVYINFNVESNGKIGGIAIGKSSGFKTLDESAIRTVKSIKQISNLPSLVQGIEQVDITVPITYRLEKEGK